MKNALIGYSGFVGSNLDSQLNFEKKYNSKNIKEIKSQKFDTVYCAGAPAAKWIANKNPNEDLQNVFKLIDCLRDVKAKRMVLISTIDVYYQTKNVNEKNEIQLFNHHPLWNP